MDADLVFEKYNVAKYLNIVAVVIDANLTNIDLCFFQVIDYVCYQKKIPIAATAFPPRDAKRIARKCHYTLGKEIR